MHRRTYRYSSNAPKTHTNYATKSMNSERQLKSIISKRDGLKCKFTGKEVANLGELKLYKVKNESLQAFGDDGREIFNPDDFVLIHKDLETSSSSVLSKRSRALETELENRISELEAQEKLNYDRERTYREQVEQQRKELEQLRDKLISEHKARDKKFSNEANHLTEELRKKELTLLDKFNAEQAVLQQRANILEEEKKSLEIQVEAHQAKISSEYAELEREKEKYKEETRRNIERRSSEYVNESITSLDSAATKYHKISRNWSIAGTIALILGVATGIFFGAKGLSPVEGKEIVEWSQVVFFAFKGVIVIGLFVALSKYCFMYGQSFMHESIKNGERKHAINFGKFYLQSYGVDAEWSQVKEAFEHWNINSASAFSGHDPDKFDPKMMDKALQFAESFQKLSKSKKPENDTTN
ncbi:hypothetical protein A1D17_21150 [Pseudomonas fluorescens]|uniref:Uncharacterized protein n=2 Tax=Pseudomonas TaxID=286 RepID=A0A166P805_PSEFL|nr:hypothetical protein A1D17_21150 [Pseudomonas fluorescens]